MIRSGSSKRPVFFTQTRSNLATTSVHGSCVRGSGIYFAINQVLEQFSFFTGERHRGGTVLTTISWLHLGELSGGRVFPSRLPVSGWHGIHASFGRRTNFLGALTCETISITFPTVCLRRHTSEPVVASTHVGTTAPQRIFLACWELWLDGDGAKDGWEQRLRGWEHMMCSVVESLLVHAVLVEDGRPSLANDLL